MSSRRKIPRFTPDPPPDIGNPQTVEELTDALWQVIEYQRRQNDRLHDWWPRDADERLAALEGLQGFTPVSMSIPVEIAAQFFAEAGSGNLLVCGGVTTLSDQEYPAALSSGILNSGYSPTTESVYFSVAAVDVVNDPGYYQVNTTNDNVNDAGLNPYRAKSSILFSSNGGMTSKNKYAIAVGAAGGGSARAILFYTLSPFSFDGATAITSYNNLVAMCENNTHILFKGSVFPYVSVTKSGLTASEVSDAAGWSQNQSAAIPNSGTTFLVAQQNTSTGHYWLVEYSGAGAMPAGDIAVSTDITQFSANAIAANSKGFWPVNKDGTAQILVTDLDGATIDIIEACPSLASNPWTFSGYDRLFADENEEYIYYFVSPYACRINTDTYEVEVCSLEIVSGITGLAYQGASVVAPNGYIYLIDEYTRAGTSMFLGKSQVVA